MRFLMCQDFSISGNKRGSMFKCSECSAEYNPLTVHHTRRDRCPNCGSRNLEKTRSSLLVHWLKILYTTRPKVALYENVKNLTSTRFKEVFDLFIAEIEEYGYNVYYKVLNAKNYGIPQNRERCFMVSILGDYYYDFPKTIEGGKTFNDILDDPKPFFEGTDERIVIHDKIMNSVKGNIIRDKELIVSSDKNIFRMECPSAFQDNVVGIKCTPTLTASNHSTIVLQKTHLMCLS